MRKNGTLCPEFWDHLFSASFEYSIIYQSLFFNSSIHRTLISVGGTNNVLTSSTQCTLCLIRTTWNTISNLGKHYSIIHHFFNRMSIIYIAYTLSSVPIFLHSLTFLDSLRLLFLMKDSAMFKCTQRAKIRACLVGKFCPCISHRIYGHTFEILNVV